MSGEKGTLYVVATPLGNLADMSRRALDVLAAVDVIAAEDTRLSGRMLAHLGIKGGRLVSLHEHNEKARLHELVEQLLDGRNVALISDAGTPLISDPGYRLVNAAAAAGVRVSPIPGPSALVAALSVAGLPTDRFVFEGFPPPKQGARSKFFHALREEERTLVFYESCHRIQMSIGDMIEAFGGERQAVIARELTKHYEQIERGTLKELAQWLATDEDRLRGEFVVILAGAERPEVSAESSYVAHLLDVLVSELPTRQAADLAARISGAPRQHLYREAQRRRQALDTRANRS